MSPEFVFLAVACIAGALSFIGLIFICNELWQAAAAAVVVAILVWWSLSGRAPTHSLPSDCHVERPVE